MLVFVLTGLIGYAVFDNRTVDLWPPKIHARNETARGTGGGSHLVAIDVIDAVIAGIDVPILVYRRQERGLVVSAANDAAASFYLVTKEQLIGKSPVDLHALIKPWITNFGEWSAEQMLRIAQTSATSSKPVEKTTVPMKLATTHPTFKGEWYITSNYIRLDEKQLVVTRFSNNPDRP
jgi:hypothetical protein